MKALVVGYGSIGRRHHRILTEAGHRVAVVSARKVDVPLLFPAIDRALDEFEPDYVVVANKTVDHLPAMEQLAERGFEGRLLVEKPLLDTPRPLPAERFERAGVGYNLRFHPAFETIRKVIGDDRVISAHAYVGQYLPDWRPDADYRKGASAARADGGGVLRDLSHELDLLTWMLGEWRSLTALGGRFGTLEIDSDDVFSILFETERCPVVTVHMNYLDREPLRSIILQTDDGTVHADLIAGSVRTRDDTIRFDVDRDSTYSNMHRAMLSDDADGRVCTIPEGMDVVGMINAIERSAKERTWVHR